MFSTREQKLAELQLNSLVIPNKIFVGGLAEQTHEEDLRGIFSEAAMVKNVQIVADRTRNDVRRYAFVEFEDGGEVRKVLDEFKLKDVELHGRRLIIHQAFRRQNTGRKYVPVMPVNPWDLWYAAAMQNMLSPSYLMPTGMLPYRNIHTDMPAGMNPSQLPSPNQVANQMMFGNLPAHQSWMPNSRNNMPMSPMESLAHELSGFGLDNGIAHLTGMNGNENFLNAAAAMHQPMGQHQVDRVPRMALNELPGNYEFPKNFNMEMATYPRGYPF